MGPSGWQPAGGDSLESDLYVDCDSSKRLSYACTSNLGETFGFDNSMWRGEGVSGSAMADGSVRSAIFDVGSYDHLARAEAQDVRFLHGEWS